MVFSVVRDPLERLVSALHELSRRNHPPHSSPHADGKWTPELHAGSLTELIATIRARGYWNAHIKPQASFLFDSRTGRQLPLDMVAILDSSFPVILSSYNTNIYAAIHSLSD